MLIFEKSGCAVVQSRPLNGYNKVRLPFFDDGALLERVLENNHDSFPSGDALWNEVRAARCP